MSELADGLSLAPVDAREGGPLRPRARPVADAPVEALAALAGQLASSWAIALIEGLPPGRISEVALGEIATGGPVLIGQVIASLASDVELARLVSLEQAAPSQPGLEATCLDILGSVADDGAPVRTVEALRGVLWEAMLDELRQARAREVAELCDRLAYVCAMLAAAGAGAATESEEPTVGGEREAALSQPSRVARPATGEISEELAFVIDEGIQERERRIEIRDTRGAEQHEGWIEAIELRLERFASDGAPFAVLLCELADRERALNTSSREPPSRGCDRVQEAFGRELGPMDQLTEESGRRYWLIVPEADAPTARLLAERLARSVRSDASDRGAPLDMTVGIAICPDHGREAGTLCSHAEVDVYAARAAGGVVAPVDDPEAGA